MTSSQARYIHCTGIELRARVTAMLPKLSTRWVADGKYSLATGAILPCADTVVWPDYGLLVGRVLRHMIWRCARPARWRRGDARFDPGIRSWLGQSRLLRVVDLGGGGMVKLEGRRR